jgi:hypothetical protein
VNVTSGNTLKVVEAYSVTVELLDIWAKTEYDPPGIAAKLLTVAAKYPFESVVPEAIVVLPRVTAMFSESKKLYATTRNISPTYPLLVPVDKSVTVIEGIPVCFET